MDIVEINKVTSQSICDELIARGEDPAELLGLSRQNLEDTYEDITEEELVDGYGWFC